MDPSLGDDPKAIQFVFQPPDRSEFYIESENLVDGVGLYPGGHQSLVFDVSPDAAPARNFRRTIGFNPPNAFTCTR